MYALNCCGVTTFTVNSMRLWYRPHNSLQCPRNVPVWVKVTSKWFGWSGMTSRLNKNSGIQNACTTSWEVRLNSTVSPVGISSTGSGPSPHMSPVLVTWYCG